jgi:hypothetical protein
MFDTGGTIDHSLREMALVLSITFMVPLIGGIIGNVVTGLFTLNKKKEKIGQKREREYGIIR